MFVHKDGHFYPVGFTASPIRDDTTRIIGTIIEVRDISEEKAAAKRQRLLTNELNHRVKNTLTTVQAIASQTLLSVDTAVRSALDNRLLAVAAVHDVLTLANWEGADMRDVVTHKFALADFKEAFAVMERGDKSLKVVLEP